MFRDRCEHWVKVFGLTGWTLGYCFEKLDTNYAESYPKNRVRVAAITLSKDFGAAAEIIGYDIKDHLNRLALQEIVHVMLEPLDDRNAPDDVRYSRHETVAHQIEHALLGRPVHCFEKKKPKGGK